MSISNPEWINKQYLDLLGKRIPRDAFEAVRASGKKEFFKGFIEACVRTGTS